MVSSEQAPAAGSPHHIDNGSGRAEPALAVDYCAQYVGDEGLAPAVPLVDPFCGYGSLLAVANARGVPAIGMDISRKCCRKAAAHTALTHITPFDPATQRHKSAH